MALYEEVVKLVLDFANFRQQSDEAKQFFLGVVKELQESGKISAQFVLDTSDYDKMVSDVMKLQQQQKEAYAKINSDIVRSQAKEELEIQKENAAAVEKQMKAMADQKIAVGKINADVAQAQAKQDIQREKENAKAIAEQFAAMEKEKIAAARAFEQEMLEEGARILRQEEEIAARRVQLNKEADDAIYNYKKRLQKEQEQQAAQFNKIFKPGGSPIKEDVSEESSFSLSKLGRIGAGAAVAAGQYNMAGGMYAISNIADTMGLATTATTGLTVALTGLVPILAGSLLYAGKDFNKALADMSTLMLPATASAQEFRTTLDSMSDAAIKLATKFDKDLVETVKGFKEAFSSGVDVADIVKFMDAVGALSASIGVSMQKSANVLTSFRDDYHLTIDDMGKVNDKIFNAINVGKLNVEDFLNNIGRVLPIAKSAGISVDDMFTAIATSSRKMTASQSITGMAQAISELTNPSTKAKKELDALGIAYGDLAFQGKNWISVIEEIAQKTGGAADEIGKIFSDQRSRRFISSQVDSIRLLKENQVEIEKLGTNAIAADRAMDTLWTNLGKDIDSVWYKVKGIGSDFANVLNTSIYGTKEEKDKIKSENEALINSYFDYLKQRVNNAKGTDSLDSIVNQFKSDVDPGKNFNYNSYFSDDARDAAFKKIEDSKAAMQEAVKRLRESVRSGAEGAINDVDTLLTTSNAKIIKYVEGIAKVKEIAFSKIQGKEFNERATDDQKQQLDNLKEQYELQKELITQTVEQEKVREESEASKQADAVKDLEQIVSKLKDQNTDPVILNTYKLGLANAKDELSKTLEAMKADFLANSPIRQMVIDAQDLQIQMGELHQKVESQDTRKEVAKRSQEEKKDIEESKKLWTEYQTLLDKLYNDDVRAYEKAQREKVAKVKQINHEIESEARRSQDLMTSIYEKIFQSQLNQRSGDPSSQYRVARGAIEEQSSILQTMAKGGANRGEFDSSVKKFEAAAEALKNAGNAIDQGRGDRVFQEKMDELIELNKEFDKNFNDRKYSAIDSANQEARQKGAVRSPQQLAADATKQIETKKTLEKVELDAKIKLQVDGTLSKQTKDELVAATLKEFDRLNKNRNRTRDYDSPKRESSSASTSVIDDGSDD